MKNNHNEGWKGGVQSPHLLHTFWNIVHTNKEGFEKVHLAMLRGLHAS